MNYTEINKKLFSYISECVSPYHAAFCTEKLLLEAGFEKLCESKKWSIAPGKKYFVTRNQSSLIAFKLPNSDPSGFMMTAAHCDSPAFKVKENADLRDGAYVRLSTEKYGGMICSTWMDRPLSIAGRVLAETASGVRSILADFKSPVAVIPSVAIHMNRNVNDAASFNASIDMLPLFGAGDGDASFKVKLCELINVDEADILATDMFLYNPQQGEEWSNFISAPRLDDLQCAFASLEAFMNAENNKAIQTYCLFDNEEVGSETKQGAASTFLYDTLVRINECLGGGKEAYLRLIANSFLVSCDNAHAQHPNHPEYSDKNHTPHLNGGVVIKYNANQRYTTDAISAGIFKKICERAKVKTQSYANRADMAGGSTLGSIANTQVSLNTVDIGLAQLAMHSSFETAGKEDTCSMINALHEFFSSSIEMNSDGEYSI